LWHMLLIVIINLIGLFPELWRHDMVIHRYIPSYGHCVAYASFGGNMFTSCSIWVVPGTLED
jgi:hypothetical protein